MFLQLFKIHRYGGLKLWSRAVAIWRHRESIPLKAPNFTFLATSEIVSVLFVCLNPHIVTPFQGIEY